MNMIMFTSLYSVVYLSYIGTCTVVLTMEAPAFTESTFFLLNRSWKADYMVGLTVSAHRFCPFPPFRFAFQTLDPKSLYVACDAVDLPTGVGYIVLLNHAGRTVLNSCVERRFIFQTFHSFHQTCKQPYK